MAERFAQIIAERNQIKVMELLFAVPKYRVMQHWHERYAHDPAVIWLRNTIADLFRE